MADPPRSAGERARRPVALCDHRAGQAEAADGFKTTAFVRRSLDVDPDYFFEYWLDVHAPNVASGLGAADGGLRYVVNHDTDADGDATFNGVAEVWYRDGEAAKAHLSAIGEDGFNALCADTMFTMGHEQVLIG